MYTCSSVTHKGNKHICPPYLEHMLEIRQKPDKDGNNFATSQLVPSSSRKSRACKA